MVVQLLLSRLSSARTQDICKIQALELLPLFNLFPSSTSSPTQISPCSTTFAPPTTSPIMAAPLEQDLALSSESRYVSTLYPLISTRPHTPLLLQRSLEPVSKHRALVARGMTSRATFETLDTPPFIVATASRKLTSFNHEITC